MNTEVGTLYILLTATAPALLNTQHALTSAVLQDVNVAPTIHSLLLMCVRIVQLCLLLHETLLF